MQNKKTKKIDQGILYLCALVVISTFIGLIMDKSNCGTGCCKGGKPKKEKCLDSDTLTKAQQFFWNQKIIRSK